MRQIGPADAAAVTAAEGSQLIGRVNMARHENCDTPTPSMGVRDCIRYKKCAKTVKLFIHLSSSSKVAPTTESKYEAKRSNIAHTRYTRQHSRDANNRVCTVHSIDVRTRQAEQSLCVHSHEKVAIVE